jgi:hypothetical protein
MNRVLVGIVFASCSIVSVAAVPTSAESEAAQMQAEVWETRNLEPMGAQIREIFEANKPAQQCIASFDAEISFLPSQHWCVEEKGDNYFIRYWGAKSGPGVKPRSSQIQAKPIPALVAQQIQQIWLRGILNARFPPVNRLGADGIHYAFGVRRYTVNELLEAHVWTPMGDYPAKWIGELGSAIFLSASTDSLGAENLAKQLIETQAKLEAFYPESHGP